MIQGLAIFHEEDIRYMKISELARFIEKNHLTPDTDILVEMGGILYDITRPEIQPETFDGFDTVYPASLKLTVND